MYRHLLVPIDDSVLSIGVVGNAVGLARAVGARITFFHAVADPARSVASDAELLRATAHDDYDYAYTGKARELLAKAEAAAHALGVPCSSGCRCWCRPPASPSRRHMPSASSATNTARWPR